MDSDPEEGELIEDTPDPGKLKAIEKTASNKNSIYTHKNQNNQNTVAHSNQFKNTYNQTPQKPAGFWQPSKPYQNKYQNSAPQNPKPPSQFTPAQPRPPAAQDLFPNPSYLPHSSHLSHPSHTSHPSYPSHPSHPSHSYPSNTIHSNTSSQSHPLTPSAPLFSPLMSSNPNASIQNNCHKYTQETYLANPKDSSALVSLPQKRQKDFEPKLQCKFWENGACSKGSSCTFAHIGEIKVKNELCKYVLTGCCTKAELCGYSHDFSKFPCKYFHGVGVCTAGQDCKFSHERLKNNEIFEFMKTHESYLKQVQEIKGETNLGEYFLLYIKSKVNENGKKEELKESVN